MGILAWIVLGLVAGALAKFIMPGQQGGGIILTIVLGVVGALVGGFLGTYVFGFGDISGFNLRSIAIAPGDSTMLHSPCPAVYPLGETQLGVHPKDRTAGPTPWTTCLASAA